MTGTARSFLTAALLLGSVVSASSVRLGCLSAAPDNSTTPTASDASYTLDACGTACEAGNYTYAFYTTSLTSNDPASCACSNSTARSDTYVFAEDTKATCKEGSTTFLGIIPTQSDSTTNTTCPYIGPGSRTSFTNYTYLSLLPTPIDCFTACALLPSDSNSTSFAGRVALLSPSSANVDERGSSWACACADAISSESYTTPCGQASWYAVTVVHGSEGKEDAEDAAPTESASASAGAAGVTGKAQRRSRR